jgi:Tol biopolymer transport system component
MWRVRLDGSGLAPLTHRAGVQPFRGLASPDGRWLALRSSPAGATLVPADRSLDSAWPAPLPAPGEGLRFEVTSFSDDGRLLAGHAIGDDETYRGVFLYDLETKAYRRLTEAGSCPQLVLGGRRAYFLRQTALL